MKEGGSSHDEASVCRVCAYVRLCPLAPAWFGFCPALCCSEYHQEPYRQLHRGHERRLYPQRHQHGRSHNRHGHGDRHAANRPHFHCGHRDQLELLGIGQTVTCTNPSTLVSSSTITLTV